jgi:hypothetical protein
VLLVGELKGDPADLVRLEDPPPLRRQLRPFRRRRVRRDELLLLRGTEDRVSTDTSRLTVAAPSVSLDAAMNAATCRGRIASSGRWPNLPASRAPTVWYCATVFGFHRRPVSPSANHVSAYDANVNARGFR